MKILIVKTSSLGDIVHAFQALSLLRKTYPDAEIDWVVEKPFAELLESHPYVNRVIPIQTRKWRKNLCASQTFRELRDVFSALRQPYDLLFDLQGNTKSGLVTAIARAKVKVGYGFQSVWEYPNLISTHVKFDPPKTVNVRDENLFLIKNYLKVDELPENYVVLTLKNDEQDFLVKFLQNDSLQNKRKVFVAPGSNWKNKQVDEIVLANFLQLLENEQSSCFLLTYGNDHEKQMAIQISSRLPCSILVEKLSLPLLQNLMAHMDLIIAMDSLPLHLAGSTGVPTFGIFGPSSALKYAPPGRKNHAMQGECPFGKVFTRRCDILRTCKTGGCIKNITAEMLFDSFNKC